MTDPFDLIREALRFAANICGDHAKALADLKRLEVMMLPEQSVLPKGWEYRRLGYYWQIGEWECTLTNPNSHQEIYGEGPTPLDACLAAVIKAREASASASLDAGADTSKGAPAS